MADLDRQQLEILSETVAGAARDELRRYAVKRFGGIHPEDALPPADVLDRDGAVIGRRYGELHYRQRDGFEAADNVVYVHLFSGREYFLGGNSYGEFRVGPEIDVDQQGNMSLYTFNEFAPFGDETFSSRKYLFEDGVLSSVREGDFSTRLDEQLETLPFMKVYLERRDADLLLGKLRSDILSFVSRWGCDVTPTPLSERRRGIAVTRAAENIEYYSLNGDPVREFRVVDWGRGTEPECQVVTNPDFGTGVPLSDDLDRVYSICDLQDTGQISAMIDCVFFNEDSRCFQLCCSRMNEAAGLSAPQRNEEPSKGRDSRMKAAMANLRRMLSSQGRAEDRKRGRGVHS